jgi:PAS domain S-box-containing protein
MQPARAMVPADARSVPPPHPFAHRPRGMSSEPDFGAAERLAVLEQLPVGLAVYRAGRLVYVNPALCQMLRYERAELLGLDPFSLLAPEDEARLRERFKARQRGEAPTPLYEIQVRRRDDTWVTLEFQPRATGPDEAVLTYRDLSPHRREHKLIESLATLAAHVQLARTPAAVRETALDGLRDLGFQVAIAAQEPDGYRLFRRTTAQLEALITPLLVDRLDRGKLEPLDACIRTQEVTYVDDALEVLRANFLRLGMTLAPEHALRLRQLGLDRIAISPLSVHGRQYGALLVAGEGMSRQAAAALSLFAAKIASGLEVTETIVELRKQNRRLEAVNALANAGNESDPAELTERLLRIVIEATSSDAAVVYRAVPEEGVLVVEKSIGAPDWFADRYRRLPLTGSVTGGAAMSGRGRALRVDDWPPEHREHVRRAGHLASALLPLVAKGRLSGTLNLSRYRDEPYSAEDLSSAELFAGQVAVQLERARLVLELRHSYDELARTQEELVKNERLAALGELAAVVAHEVRNPLGVVFNSLSSLRRINPSPEAKELLGIVSEESERLDRLVSDLLDFARPHQPRLESEQPRDVVASAVEAAKRGNTLGGATIKVEVPGDLPAVLVDAPLCRQALLNLLLNGAQATQKGGEVVVRASLDRSKALPAVRVDVCDGGVGIAPEVAGRIFQPFFTTRAAGTGLGLAVVKRIADAHGAELSFESRPGHGTTFSLWLPLATPDDAGA